MTRPVLTALGLPILRLVSSESSILKSDESLSDPRRTLATGVTLPRMGGEAGKGVVMRSPCVGAALDPPLWTVVPNKALSLRLSLSLALVD